MVHVRCGPGRTVGSTYNPFYASSSRTGLRELNFFTHPETIIKVWFSTFNYETIIKFDFLPSTTNQITRVIQLLKPDKLGSLRARSVNPLHRRIGTDWRGLRWISTCRGFNPFQPNPGKWLMPTLDAEWTTPTLKPAYAFASRKKVNPKLQCFLELTI